MWRTLLPAVALSALAVGVSPAAAQATSGPTPREQVGIHIGDTTTNGSAVIVTDRNGTHPDGYPGFSVINRTAASGGPTSRHRHHIRRHHASDATG